ncbi:FAD-binding oxidoreductase [Mycetocola zhadangensis]|uniref:FAD-binding oxidoreductase n=1 Tax=Mycetocola zhadangensis TaxID=1164595 RepID=A0A3L7J3C8_9MICO|nr:FAD-binding oxidoreductase [Mycetocola zhadangensis]RLQ83931.1 FAD-binding oxidoreductase [Mycetocola zhadangensis]GGE97608.1 FAD-linked oxidase [Mycetocola zhadangensis]
MTFSPTDVTSLRAALTGEVFERGDEGMAAAVAAQNTLVVHDPDIAVAVADEADVSTAVRFAAEHDLPVTVQATGHGAWRPVASGLIILTSSLNSVSVDENERIATIGAGARWSAVIDKAAPFGLAPITGSSPHVGAIGYTLGGGLGPLSRSHGFTADWVRGFRVVLADGSVAAATPAENPDLFWALRGGKGGLGIVTEMRLELVPLRTLYAGSLLFDTPNIETALRTWVDWTRTAPDTVTTSIALLSMPPIDEVPELLRGKFLLSMRFAYPGGPAEGARLLEPLRQAAPVYLDGVTEIPATAMGSIHADPDQPSPIWDLGLLLGHIDQDFVTELLASFGPDANSPFVATEIRHLGGATYRDVDGGSAVGGRTGAFTLTLIGVVPPLFERMPVVANAFLERVRRFISPETNINFSARVETPDHFAQAWPPETFERLAQVRATYDPEGLFAFGPAETVAQL